MLELITTEGRGENEVISEVEQRTKEVIELVDLIADDYLAVITLANVIRNLPPTKEALEFAVSKAVERASRISDEEMLARALIILALALSRIHEKLSSKLFLSAIEIASEIKDKTLRDLTLVEIANSLIRDGKLMIAGTVAENITIKKKRDELLARIIMKLANVGSIRQAMLYIEKIENEPYYSIARIHLARALIRERMVLKAFNLLAEIQDVKWLKEGIRIAVTELFNVINTIDDNTFKVIIQLIDNAKKEHDIDLSVEVVILFLFAKEFEKAGELLKDKNQRELRFIARETVKLYIRSGKLGELLKNINSFPSTIAPFIVMSIADYLADNPDESLYEVAHFIEELTTDPKALVKLVAYYVKIGQINDALALAENIRTSREKSLALTYVIVALLKDNRLSDALDTIELINDPYYRQMALSEVLPQVMKHYRRVYAESKFKLLEQEKFGMLSKT